MINLSQRKTFFWIILSLVIILRLISLDKGIAYDEKQTFLYAKAPFAEKMELIRHHFSNPPLTVSLLYFWMLPSQNEVWVRLYFVLFGVGLCILVYLIGKEYLGDEFGLLSFALAGFSPLLIWASQYIRGYVDSAFWIVLSSFFFLKMIKGRYTRSVCAGYIISSALALYTFYFTALILLSQGLYLLIFWWRDRPLLKRWLSCTCLTGLLFAPWVPVAFSQIAIVTGVRQLPFKGFQILGLPIGMFLRNLMTMVGMEPYFLSAGASEILDNKFLLLNVILILLIFVAVLILGCLSLKRLNKGGRVDFWFFVFLSLGPVILANTLGRMLSLSANAKYLVAPQAMFIYFFAAVIYYFILQRKKKYAYIFCLCLLSLFLLRLPSAYTAEFDFKGAHSFICAESQGKGCIFVFKKRFDEFALPAVDLGEFFQRDKASGEYLSLPDIKAKELKERASGCARIYLYLSFGRDKVFGANKAAKAFFNRNFELDKKKTFRNIEVLSYKKR